MAAPTPRMHGLTHVPGGPDPIPGLTAPAASFFDAVMASPHISELRGYWRLGDGAHGPYADSKQAVVCPSLGAVLANAPMARVDNTVDMTDVNPGALAAGDDGAVQFNEPTGAATSDYLSAPNTWGTGASNPFQAGIGANLTVAGWVKPAASTSTFDGGIFSMHSNPGPLNGYVLGVTWPARTVFFEAQTTRLTGPVLTAGAWVFVAAVTDATSTRIYVNGALVATGTAVTPTPSTNISPLIGFWNSSSGTSGVGPGVLYGAVDEVTVWGVALTAAELAALYTAGAGAAPPAPPVDISGKVDRDAVEAATNRLVQVKLAAGDTQPAFRILGDGTHQWGPGGTTAPTEMTLRRSAFETLKLEGTFRAGFDLYAQDGTPQQVGFGGVGPAGQAGVSFGTASDARLYRLASGEVKTDNHFRVGQGLLIDMSDGGNALFFGSAYDAYIYRAGSSMLQTSSSLTVGANLKVNGSLNVLSKNVTVGAPDSGGAGYRALVVPN